MHGPIYIFKKSYINNANKLSQKAASAQFFFFVAVRILRLVLQKIILYTL